MGFHFWRELDLSGLDLSGLDLEKEVRFCFWCSKIRINKVIFTPF